MTKRRLKIESCKLQIANWGKRMCPAFNSKFAICNLQFAIPFLFLCLLGANRIDGKRLEGFTEPYQTIAVAAAENGIVQEVRVELGQAVKKGEVLGTLDDDLLKATLEIGQLKANSTAAIDAAKAELDIKEQKLRIGAGITVVAGASRPRTEARRLSYDPPVISAPILSRCSLRRSLLPPTADKTHDE